jgi:hypothetical protein
LSLERDLCVLNQTEKILRELGCISDDLNDDLREVRQKCSVWGVFFEELREEIDLGLNVGLVLIFLEVDHLHKGEEKESLSLRSLLADELRIR